MSFLSSEDDRALPADPAPLLNWGFADGGDHDADGFSGCEAQQRRGAAEAVSASRCTSTGDWRLPTMRAKCASVTIGIP